MTRKDFRLDIKGYTDILQEIEVCRKYGEDYRSLKGRWMEYVDYIHPSLLELKVADIIQETAKTKTLRLIAVSSHLPPFQAGQYINVFVNIDGVRTSRPYSISSSPNQTAYYDITVGRIKEGFVSDYLLDKIKVGHTFEASSPTGTFYYNPLFHGNDLVFIAGGTGITPFMSMIREVMDKGIDRNIQLLYGCNLVEDAIFHDELTEKASKYNNFKYDLVVADMSSDYTGLKGLINAELVKENVNNIKSKTFYICGPRAMYEFCLPQLEKLGIAKRKIRQEVFSQADNVTKSPGWPGEIAANHVFTVNIKDGRNTGQTITAQAGEPLVVALERNGIQVPTSCRSGACSLCRVKVLKGNVFETSNQVRKSDRDSGYIHSCSAYPLSDLEVLL